MENAIIIGLDGGASKIRGGILYLEPGAVPTRVVGCSPEEEITYSDMETYCPDFLPVPLPIQLEEFRNSRIILTEQEKKQGSSIVAATALIVKKLTESVSCTECVVGIGMPGLKTLDGSGIAVMANGPRIPTFKNDFTNSLSRMGIKLKYPLGPLGSDADYCGIGERYSREGLLRDVDTAYYLGIGTGIADAMIIRGDLIPLDRARSWIAKSWELMCSDGMTFEKRISMSAIEKRYREKNLASLPPFHAGDIFEKALKGDSVAAHLIEEVAGDLASLIYDRIYTLWSGGTKYKMADPQRLSLNREHPFLGDTWERIVLAQRMGHLWKKEIYTPFFQKKVYFDLYRYLSSMPETVQHAYLQGESVKSGLIVASTLDCAPIIGAGISAYLATTAKKN